jgi:energy-coupling factor transporter ATP-binding protein EcfA2
MASITSILIAVSINLLVTSHSRESLGITVLLTLSVAAFILTLVPAFVFSRSEVSADLQLSRDTAIKRLKIVLSSLRDSASREASYLDIPMSIVLQRRERDKDIFDEKTMSAFIATLTSDPRCTIVTGAPGSGKSTLLRHLAAEMINSREAHLFGYTPLFLQSRGWESESNLTQWVTGRVRITYGIPSKVTRSWIKRGEALLILDGIDELPEANWSSFASQVNSWLRSPVGGRAILSCRTDAYVGFFKSISHEQVADLQPLSDAAIQRYFFDILTPKVHDSALRDAIGSLLRNVVLPRKPEQSSWATPLLMRIVADGLLDVDRPQEDAEFSEDPGALAVVLGDRLNRQGDASAAITSYLAAVNNRSSALRSLGGVRASILLARTGDYEGARRALQLSLASEIERSINAPLTSPEDELTADDQAVLKALSSTISLDAFQLSSSSSVPPSRCNEALRRLRERGLAEVVDTERGEPRFCRSAVELVDK